MKKHSSLSSWLAVSLVVLFFSGCNKTAPTPVPVPSISAISPTSGAIGTTVIITGANFSTFTAGNTVKFNGTAATVTAATGTSLTTTVPAGGSTGAVTVTTSGGTATGSAFTVISAPTITSISPTSGMAGAAVTITGTNFSTTAGSNAVTFNGTTATVTAATSTSLTTTVPAAASTGAINVTTSGGTAIGPVFTFIASSAKQITAFAFNGLNPAVTGVIDQSAFTITLTVPNGTNVTTLTPTIAVSTGATLSPLTGTAQNFSSPVTYTVTAADLSTQTYAVTVTGNSGSIAWTQPFTLNSQNIYALVVSGSNVYAGTDQGLFVSANNGSTWTAVSSGFPASVSVGKLAVSGSTIFAGTSAGVYYSTNSGSSWTATTSSTIGLISALAMSGTNTFVGAGTFGAYISSDNGNNWTAINTGLPANGSVNLLVVNGSSIFAAVTVMSGGAPGTGTGVYLSTNNGGSWNAVDTGLPQIPVLNSLAVSGSNIIAAITGFTSPGVSGGSGVYLSANSGSTWTFPSNTGLQSNTYVTISIAVSGSKIFAGTGFGGVFQSTDNGNSWTAVNNGLNTASSFSAMVIIGNTLITGDDISGRGVFVTSF